MFSASFEFCLQKFEVALFYRATKVARLQVNKSSANFFQNSVNSKPRRNFNSSKRPLANFESYDFKPNLRVNMVSLDLQDYPIIRLELDLTKALFDSASIYMRCVKFLKFKRSHFCLHLLQRVLWMKNVNENNVETRKTEFA